MLRVLLAAFLLVFFSCKRQESKPPEVAPEIEKQAPDKVDLGTPRELDLYGDPLPEGAIGRLGSLRMIERHIESMIFSANGSQVISTAKGGYQIWNLTDVSRGGLLPDDSPGDLMTVSPDDKFLATANDTATEIHVWDLSSGSRSAQVTTPAPIIGMCFVDDTHLAALSATEIITWELGSRRPTRVAGGWDKASAFGCSQGAGWFGIGTEEGDAYVMKIGGDKGIKLGKADKAIRAVAISHKGSTFAFGSDDESIRIWNESTPGPALEMQGHTRLVTSLAFTGDDSKLYSSGGDSWFRIWDPKTSEMLEEMTGIEGLDAQLMAMSPDGNLMVSWSQYANARGSEAGRWWLWNATTGAPLLEPQRHSKSISSVEFSPDGKHVLTSGEDRSVRVWNRESSKGEAILEVAEGSVNDAHFSPDGALVYSAGVDALLSKWDWQSGEEKMVFESIGGAVNCFIMTSDGSRTITGDQIGRVWSWDMKSGNKISAHDGGGYSAIYAMDLSKDGKLLAIAGSDRLIRILDFHSGKEVASINPGDTTSNHAVRFSPDGRILATAGDSHKIDTWNTEDWSHGKSLTGHDGTVRALEFSPDGLRLISGGNDEMVRVWDYRAGTELVSYQGHQGVIHDLAVSPDSTTIASASRDRTVVLWPVP